MSRCTGCNQTVDPCEPKCGCSTPKPCGCGKDNGCDKCSPTAVETALYPCDWPQYCADGCVDTISDLCSIYKGPTLQFLDVKSGAALRNVLIKFDRAMQTQAVMFNKTTTAPNRVISFRHTVACSMNIKLKSLKRDNVAVITTETTFGSLSELQAYLITRDANFTFNGLQVLIKGTNFWEMETSC